MPVSETWLLPDGVADVLPEQAQVIEQLRRRLLESLASRGYELVYTPFIEYVESLSLLNRNTSDLDLVTFKLIDQISGRLLGVRADITPQVARIDAHVRPVEGIARYCYAATVLHTRPQGLSASRAPLQLGAELFGCKGPEADLEMADLMLSLLKQAGFEHQLHLDLGHVGIFRNLARIAGLTDSQEAELTDLYQRKAIPELAEYTQTLNLGQDFYVLGRYGNDLSTLKQQLSAQVLADPTLQQALNVLEQAQAHIQQYWPAINVGVDAAELRGYHYHTGLMFAVYGPNRAVPLAQGGRYDGIGIAFGRERAATGFSCDLYVLAQANPASDTPVMLAPLGKEPDLQAAIEQARQDGFVVIQALNEQDQQSRASQRLVHNGTAWQRQSV
ncbi:ATP phosphoribosyltransferase regulatory subunit [Alkanindiges hydrocarboniclasticus]|uniref:ATP phosphoribosyltransferase regulatory subunit n=1 Tax=Alkanindiges hydrocarboniclasticus TaxID=1907941 RepID=A0A1S8CZA4_9GAMM|nr:ATP phosphoribosyltransferase regulatory subunit [Alkanindiges hydrocarboniclasticus]ONG41935.1 ATP phosphoribosyltransferase regulatory subunit [Alkanindiges hydrocarboniclasticus]